MPTNSDPSSILADPYDPL